MTLTELKIIYRMGDKIEFELSNDREIPNLIIINGSVVGKVSKSTTNAFEKWLNKELR